MFSELFFGNLAAFSLLAIAPLLALAYLRKENRKKTIVSSVLILRALPKQQFRKRKIKLPLRFFLELLALLLLMLAAARPIYTSPGERVAILVDNSLSMGALNGGTTSRFEEGIKSLKSWFNEESSLSRYDFFVSSPTLELKGKSLSRREVISELNNLKPVYATDNIERGIKSILSEDDFDSLIVVTDRPVAISDENYEPPIPVNVLQVGKPEANMFIAQIKTEITSAKRRTIIAVVGNANTDETSATVNLYGTHFGLKNNNIEETLLFSKDVSIPAQSTVDATFALPNTLGDLNVFKATIETSSSNALSADDSAWLTFERSGETTVLLVTPRSSTNALGLGDINALSIKAISPEEYGKLSEDEIKDFRAIIFDRSAPKKLPHVSSLLLIPPRENGIFPITNEIKNPKITSWDNNHLITSYLKIPLLSPQASLVFDVPSWSQSIINSQKGSLMVAGESEGLRFATTGFSLLPFEGRKTPVESILTLNVLSWLTGNKKLSEDYLTGTIRILENANSWTVRLPSGETVSLTSGEDSLAKLALKTPGAYALAKGGSNDYQLFVANSLFPEESDTFREYPFNFSSFSNLNVDNTAKISKSSNSNTFWQAIVWLAILMLLIELSLRTVLPLLRLKKGVS